MFKRDAVVIESLSSLIELLTFSSPATEHPSYFPSVSKSPVTLIDVKYHFRESRFDMLQSEHKIVQCIKTNNKNST